MTKVSLESIEQAYKNIQNIIIKTPLELNHRLSQKYEAKVYLKREDLQTARSYKIRGAYNCISLLSEKTRKNGIVCASAGNHAQGVALSCSLLKIKGYIYMPKNTPKQKIERVRALGGKWIALVMAGDTFDEASKLAKEFSTSKNKFFVHPFDDPMVISGQGTVGIEIEEQLGRVPDYTIIPVGGGGLISGTGTYLKARDKNGKIIGVEPLGAASMRESLGNKKVTTLEKIDKFVDGAAVKTPGELTFKITSKVADTVLTVPEGRVCQEMVALYQNEGIVTEPAGALSVSALCDMKKEIKGKTVVCVVSGGNNDISRYSEVIERSLIFQGLKHYFLIEFPQRPGALRSYLDEVLGPNDDITLFEYIKKDNRENGPALVGLEIAKKEDLKSLIKRMDKLGFKYELIQSDSVLYRFVV